MSMLPILELSLASVAGKSRMFRRALVALIEGALLAVALSSIIGWIAHALPFGALLELPSEVISRTRPTHFDLGIAIAGVAAAAYAHQYIHSKTERHSIPDSDQYLYDYINADRNSHPHSKLHTDPGYILYR